MSEQIDLSRIDRGSTLYEQFTERSREQLRTDSEFRAAKEEWTDYFETSHGEIFERIPDENPETRLFIDSLYYDFVVDRIIEFAEESFGFSIENRETRANTDALSFSFRSLQERVVDSGSVTEIEEICETTELRSAGTDFLRTLYEGIISREVRLALGEYYTPRGVAELAVDATRIDDIADTSFLDPGCGSGVFLSVCIEAKLDAMRGERSPADIVDNVTGSVLGIDLNPVAVKSSKLSYLLTLLPVLEADAVETVELPVFLTDALGLTREDTITFRGEPFNPVVSHLVGNPPWITWDRLSPQVKEAWRERYVDDLNLLPSHGKTARLGHSNDDISIPYVWVCIDRYLQEAGQASFVLKRDIMKGPAGTALRRLRVGDRQLAVSHIHDFNRVQPFGEQVGADAAVYTVQTDTEPSFPIRTTAWTSGGETADFSTRERIEDSLRQAKTGIVPLDSDDSTAAWIRKDAERGALGACAHEIRHGVKDDCQAVFSIDRDQLDGLENELVYPYLKSRHVVKYGLFGHELRLVPVKKANENNEDELQAEYPDTYQYLSEHREQLEDRASSWLQDGTFYNIFGIGEYTWAEYKVVWCRLGFKPHFAVVSTVEDSDLGEKTVVPGDHYMFIGTDSKREAHFLCALLNSAVYQKSLRDIAADGKSSLSKSVVSELALPAWQDSPESNRLAALSMNAHEIVPTYTDRSKRAYNRTTIDELEPVQAEIDEIVEGLVTGSREP